MNTLKVGCTILALSALLMWAAPASANSPPNCGVTAPFMGLDDGNPQCVVAGDVVEYKVIMQLPGTFGGGLVCDIAGVTVTFFPPNIPINGPDPCNSTNGITVGSGIYLTAGSPTATTITSPGNPNPGNQPPSTALAYQVKTADEVAKTLTVKACAAGTLQRGTGEPTSDQRSLSTSVATPSIQLTKTANPTLTKVGHDVTYTLTITNPGFFDGTTASCRDLVLVSLDDSLMGNLLDPLNPYVIAPTTCSTSTPLAANSTCIVTAKRTVLATDPNPLVNTATVHAHAAPIAGRQFILANATPLSATAKATVNLFTPKLKVVKTCPDNGGQALLVGGTYTWSIQMTNTSTAGQGITPPALENFTITDKIDGDAAIDLMNPANFLSNTCLASALPNGLAAGQSCLVTYKYTIPDVAHCTDVVDVHANPHGFTNDITPDPNDVNNVLTVTCPCLKTPPWEVTKTCLTSLTKNGDTASYKVVIKNDEIPGTPGAMSIALTSISDTCAGDLMDLGNTNVTNNGCSAVAFTLAPDASCEIDYTCVVPLNNTQDPFPNTVTVFADAVVDSMRVAIGHKDSTCSTNLFQPKITVSKECPPEVAQGALVVGQTYTWTITIQNTGSSDSPDMFVDSIDDTLAGSIPLGECDGKALTSPSNGVPGGTCTVTYQHQLAAEECLPSTNNKGDIVTNEVTVHAHPLDFKNDIIGTASKDCPCGVPFEGCRVTGGGNNTTRFDASGLPIWDGTEGKGHMPKSKLPDGTDFFTFGGQAGAPSASEPPSGEWTHRQHSGPDGQFTFHAGTKKTKINSITCSDPGACQPARANANDHQIDFDGIGEFKNVDQVAKKTLGINVGGQYWFHVHIEDAGEPGAKPELPICAAPTPVDPAVCCAPLGSDNLIVGLDNLVKTLGPIQEFVNCKCADFYRITIWSKGTDPTTDATNKMIYQVFGYIDGGNFQIHPNVDTHH